MAASENMKFLSLVSVLVATFLTQGATAFECTSDYPFPSCPRPSIDDDDDTVCCIINDDYTCCNGAVLALWAVIVICCVLLLVIVGLCVLVCCVCPCCLCAARRRQPTPVVIHTSGQAVGNQGGFDQPSSFTYQNFSK